MLSVVLVSLLFIVLALGGLRLNKLRRDARRSASVFVSNPTMEQRPSIRILGSEQPESPSLEVQRPRVDPNRNYVFGENVETIPNMSSLGSPREQWALSKSASRSKFPRGSSKTLMFALGVVAILVAIGTILTQR